MVLSGSKWPSASEDLPRAISHTTQKCPARRGTEPQGLLTSEGHNPPGWRQSGHHGAVCSPTKPGPVKPWCSLGLGASSRIPLPKGLQVPRPTHQLSPQLGQNHLPAAPWRHRLTQIPLYLEPPHGPDFPKHIVI